MQVVPPPSQASRFELICRNMQNLQPQSRDRIGPVMGQGQFSLDLSIYTNLYADLALVTAVTPEEILPRQSSDHSRVSNPNKQPEDGNIFETAVWMQDIGGKLTLTWIDRNNFEVGAMPNVV